MALELVSKLPYDHPYRWDGTLFGGPKLWRPDELGADLALWLDAADASTITLNGSTVSQWNDKSGNSRNLSQATAANQPTYLSVGFSGKPSIRSDGADFLDIGTTSLGRNVGGLTAAIVGMYPVGATIPLNSTDFFVSTDAGIQLTRFGLSPNLPGATANKYAIGGRRLDTDSFASIGSTTDSLANRGTPWIRIGNRDYSGGVVNHFTNGTQDITNFAVQGAGNTSDTDSPRTAIFAGFGGFATTPSNTELSEIVVTHSTLTTTDRQKLEGYLAWKWGLEANLPGTHPYRYTPPTTDEPAWDADALDYIGRIQDADGQGLERNVRIAIDDFVKGCKTDGIWGAIKASCILAGARTLNGALQPLVGTAPTNFNFVSGDYSRTTGLLGDGSTKYLTSNRTNDVDPQNSRHKAVWVTSPQSSSFGVFIGAGVATDSGADYIGFNETSPDSTAVSRCLASSTLGILPAPSLLTGFFGIARALSSNYNFRFNNVANNISVASTPPTTGMINVFRRDNAAASPTNARIAFYSIGESLDLDLLDARVTALINAYGAL